MGFGEHPHDNMEIITIPLEGSLKHQDSMGNGSVIRKGEIQVMSAGTGITHSEFNASSAEPLKLLQIWVYSKVRGAEPRYDQFEFRPLPKNALKQIVSPDPNDEGSWIHQDAWFHFGSLDNGKSLEYALRKPGNGVYVFIIEGSVSVNGTKLEKRDGAGFVGETALKFQASADAEFLVMEVPVGE